MTKEEFLKDFDDINFMYNNAMMKDSLERHIDDLLESEFEHLKAVIRFNGLYNERIEDLIDKHITELKGENK